MQCQPRDLQAVEGKPARKRLRVEQPRLQCPPGDQRGAGGVGQRHVVETDRPVHTDTRRVAGRHREADVQVCRDTAPRHLDGQRRWQITEVRDEVEVGHREPEHTGTVRRERRGLRAAVERRGVEPKGQSRLDLDLDVCRQAREEGQREVQRVDLLHALDRTIVEADLRIAHLEVVERETGRLVGGFDVGLRREARDQVVDVVAALPGARDTKPQRVDLKRLDHWRKAQQRCRRHVRVQPAHLKQRLAGRRQPRNGEVGQAEGHRPRPEFHLAERHAASERLARAQRELPLEQRRNGQPERDQECRDCRDEPPEAPHGSPSQ